MYDGQDFHYAATLVAMGDAYNYQSDYRTAADYYKKGLAEIEKHTGKNANYDRVFEKYQEAKRLSSKETWRSNLERSREFYETVGKQMIHEKFPQYENRIAVGMVGEGSDCYGFDEHLCKVADRSNVTANDYRSANVVIAEVYGSR